MYYCRKCEIKNDWPESFGKSYGNCECCGVTGTCNNISSKLLPIPKKPLDDEQKEYIEKLAYYMNEDMDYCFKKYSGFQEIEDEKFHELRKKYLDASQELEEYVIDMENRAILE